jgi:hypothetical protein
MLIVGHLSFLEFLSSDCWGPTLYWSSLHRSVPALSVSNHHTGEQPSSLFSSLLISFIGKDHTDSKADSLKYSVCGSFIASFKQGWKFKDIKFSSTVRSYNHVLSARHYTREYNREQDTQDALPLLLNCVTTLTLCVWMHIPTFEHLFQRQCCTF